MLLIQTLRYAQCFAYRWVKFAEYEVYGEDEKNYKKDGSWVWVEDEEHIKVQYRDSSGGIQRWYAKKDDIKKDMERRLYYLLLLPVLRVWSFPIIVANYRLSVN